jgi:hypothetical protein
VREKTRDDAILLGKNSPAPNNYPPSEKAIFCELSTAVDCTVLNLDVATGFDNRSLACPFFTF